MEQQGVIDVVDLPLSELLGGPNPVLDAMLRKFVEQAEEPTKPVCAFNSAV